MENPPIYTIGYGSRSLDDLVALLKKYQIAFLIDVRSKPYSKFKPEFTKDALELRINHEGLKYVFMGDTLGGQSDLPSVFTDDGKVDYGKLREKDFFQHGIQRLQDAWNKKLHVAIMCSEGKPEMCHRSKLIGEVLVEKGIDVMHIDETGKLISQQDTLLRLSSGQMSLFESDHLPFTSRKSYLKNPQESEDE